MEIERSIEVVVGAGSTGEETPQASLEPVPRSPQSLGGSLSSLPVLTQSQTDVAYLLASEGLDPEQIAQMMAIDRVGAIRKLLRKKVARVRVAQLKGEVLREELEHKHQLSRMLPKSRRVLDEAMDRGNTKERSQVAQWLHEAVIAKPAQKQEITLKGKLEHDLTPIFQQMGEHLAALRRDNQQEDPLDRVEIGSAKLVRMLPETLEK